MQQIGRFQYFDFRFSTFSVVQFSTFSALISALLQHFFSARAMKFQHCFSTFSALFSTMGQDPNLEVIQFVAQLAEQLGEHKTRAAQLTAMGVCDRHQLPTPDPLFLTAASPYLNQPLLPSPAPAAPHPNPTKRAEPPGVLERLAYNADRPFPVQQTNPSPQTEQTAPITEALRLSIWQKYQPFWRGLIFGTTLLILWRTGWLSWMGSTAVDRLKAVLPLPPAIEAPAPAPVPEDSPTPIPEASPPPLLPSSPVPPPADQGAAQPTTEQTLEDILQNKPAAQ